MGTNKRVFRYKRLAVEIEEKITNGTYKVGEKLPSIRQLHKRLDLSISTIFRAYVDLETNGWIEARPKSGYYVKPELSYRPQAPVPSDVPASRHKVALPSFVNRVLKAMNNPEYLHLGSAVIAPDYLPYRPFLKILKQLNSHEMKSIVSYNLPQGDPELRRQLAIGTLGVMEGIGAEDIIVTNGCTEAMSLSLKALVKPGDTIAIESPTFYGVLPLLEELDVFVVEVPTDPIHGADVDALARIVHSNKICAGLFMPNFHNPLGALMTDEKKRQLVQLANEYQMPIIEVDVNSELFYGKKRPLPLKAFDENDMVLTCSSFSKTVASGLRIGWVIPGKRYIEKIQKLKTGFSVSTSSLDQYLLAKFLESGVYERHLRSLRDRVKKQVNKFARTIQLHFPLGTRLAVPQGGILLWIQLPDGTDGFDLYRKALEHRISILPGVVCSSSKKLAEYIRIGCGFPFTREMEEGIATLGALTKSVG